MSYFQEIENHDTGDESMWYHKTKLGTFWIVESEDNHQFYLGLDEESLGCYKKLEDAIQDIRLQKTGNLKWDEHRAAEVPEDVVHEWEEGEPENWEKF